MNNKLQVLRKKAMQLPLTPGVYLMKNSRGEIIYVGKAKALKNRVSQYFGSQNNHGIKVRKLKMLMTLTLYSPTVNLRR